ncbi:MAG TPA: ChbG/HpnK family deacetylase, partial [Aggregatilineales bacterium]|nr:ChbG/HpnK family deacetylase [Aggregatilineales bacterium]
MSADSPTILIVNADDFGLTEGTNRAIVEAFQQGIVTSTSLLANGYAFDHAIELAEGLPDLGIGVHLTLTEGPSVASDVPELLAGDGLLPLSNQPFARAALL